MHSIATCLTQQYHQAYLNGDNTCLGWQQEWDNILFSHKCHFCVIANALDSQAAEISSMFTD